MTTEADNKLAKTFTAIMSRVRANEPLIHCMTHAITMNDSANAILAVGASPTMASHPKEVEEITAAADSLVVNLGNINEERLQAMKIAGARAHALELPILLDAVGAACSTLRLEYARAFIEANHPGIIKGNSSEIRALCGLPSHAHGVDAGAADAITGMDLARAAEPFAEYARAQHTVLLITGAIDLVTDGTHSIGVTNGTPMLGRLTGTGCMVGALAGTWYSSGDAFAAAALGTVYMGLAGEVAAKDKPGLGTFHMHLLDALGSLTPEQVVQEMKIVYA